jgi:hypothetical protein
LLTDVLNNTHSGKRAAQSSNILSWFYTIKLQ